MTIWRKMAKTSTSFKKGHSGLKKKGTVHNKTKVLQKIGMNNWEAFGNWIETEGIERFKEEIQSLNGKDYITATSLILEFFKPKLTRSAVSIDTKIHIESVIFE
jgi:hypothetical protein